MRLFGLSLLAAVGGYLVGALAGMALVLLLSSNSHDRSLEAAMTAFFVTGPLAAVLAAAVAFVALRRA